MITKLSEEEREALRKLLLEYNEREALHDWARKCFSSGAKIFITVAALVASVSGLSAFFGWIAAHIK